GISAENWALVLDEIGFESVQVYPQNNNCSQQIIAAQSNGLIEEEKESERGVIPAKALTSVRSENNSTLEMLKTMFADILQTKTIRR
ncbi:MAG: hypothetical protein MK066_07015, partial [Crocinitomicaceae bacterium]|nr:hypothetical protein [Crocinitomicaceae bacterium]